MTPRNETDRGRIFEARAEDVYPLLAPGSVQLVISDGPYALKKAAWDSMDVADLPEWYRPHIAAWGVVCAEAASVYVWGTSASWAAVHPEMLAAGWTFRGLIVWHKTGGHPALIGARSARCWPDITEVVGHYQRGGAFHENPGGGNVWASSPANMARLWATGAKADRLSGTLQRVGLHPCQKPLLFVERIIRASSRPGDLVCSPFGGTCREAVVCEGFSPSEARRYVCVEVNDDGVDYIGPAIEELEAARGQAHLFGGAPAQDPEPTGQQGGLF